MPLMLDEQQTMLRESVRDFLAQEAPVSHLRQLRDQRHADGLSLPLWRQFGYMGYAGTLLPESQGGLALGHADAAIIMEELGRHLTPSPFWSTAVLGVTALRAGNREAQQHVHLPGMGTGETVAALALEERAKHDPAGVSLQARRQGHHFLLDGTKTFVVNGHIADVLIVVARTGAATSGTDGLTLFLVDPKAPGVRIERSWMVDSHNAARVHFEQVSVAEEAVLGEVDQGWRVLEPVLLAGRAAVAAELVGLGDEVFNRTLGYLRERVQFGRRIGEFQALQHRAARVYAQLELARAAAMKAAWALDQQDAHRSLWVSVAKAKAGCAATLAVQEAVQMHGGMGVTEELDIGLFMKRARVLDETLGDHRFHAHQVALHHGY
ncbi:acyl-CoA dehydrogenase family protein [Hydrogenophaga sp.]|uniref:acyl-CoA dehydrogenase family protein n=1 Tax=Hydrogenophaga sp. TaxID=1904254 RepID=UPI002635B50B|nr:acyl-CoA dehydrogenase family protein [Hydrogenophaga sp.]MCW5652187.1 acyl-CoA dehydrogenase family protein [Hydrogenophaga sp.]